MADLTVFAEALISTAARAFYEDEVVCLIDGEYQMDIRSDCHLQQHTFLTSESSFLLFHCKILSTILPVLIRDKFLRDDDMALRLQLPVKKLRATLQFLANEHIVSEENVDDLHEGGSQATRFFYIDYNRAVHSIRLRLHLLRKQLEKAELQARSSSFYLCPGYKEKRCNGRYTEEEAQRVLDFSTGLFLCQECSRNYENDPHKPPLETYTLQLVDNEKDLKLAMDNLRRLNVQLSAKSIGNVQLRPGIYDLLQKVRGKGKTPIISNLPSDNFSLGIGSKRLAGTGRTAGIKAEKMKKKGLAESSAEARKYLVGNSRSSINGEDILFLKSAHGHEIQFTVEKGGGARAQVLATARSNRKRKLLDTAASRVGVSLPIPLQVEEALRRKAEEEERKLLAAASEEKKAKRAATVAPTVPEFLLDNIGRGVDAPATANGAAKSANGTTNGNGSSSSEGANGYSSPPELVLDDEIEELRRIPEDHRIAAFQAQYKLEMERQSKLLQLTEAMQQAEEDELMEWEDGF